MKLLKTSVFLVAGFFAGGWGLFQLTTVTIWWFFPELRNIQTGLYPPDGDTAASDKFDLAATQLTKLLNFVCYMGAILGVLTASAALKVRHARLTAAWICLLGGGFTSFVAVMMMYPFKQSLGEYVGYYSPLGIWSILLFVWGLRLGFLSDKPPEVK